MVEAANETGERWAAMPAGAPIDALREMATLTAEIICRTVFGPRLGRENATVIVASFSEYQRLVGQLDLMSLIGLPDWLPRFYSPAIRRAARRIHEVLDDIIRRCEGGGEASMIRLLLEPQDPKGLARRGRAVAAASPSAALGQARPLHPGAVSARECRDTATLQLCSVQRRAAGLRRAGFRADRGDPLPRDIGPACSAAPL